MRVGHRRHGAPPSKEARLERLRLQARQHAPEPSMGRDALGPLKERPPPRLFRVIERVQVGKAVSATDDSAEGNEQNDNEVVVAGLLKPRIKPISKVSDERREASGCKARSAFLGMKSLQTTDALLLCKVNSCFYLCCDCPSQYRLSGSCSPTVLQGKRIINLVGCRPSINPMEVYCATANATNPDCAFLFDH